MPSAAPPNPPPPPPSSTSSSSSSTAMPPPPTPALARLQNATSRARDWERVARDVDNDVSVRRTAALHAVQVAHDEPMVDPEPLVSYSRAEAESVKELCMAAGRSFAVLAFMAHEEMEGGGGGRGGGDASGGNGGGVSEVGGNGADDGNAESGNGVDLPPVNGASSDGELGREASPEVNGLGVHGGPSEWLAEQMRGMQGGAPSERDQPIGVPSSKSRSASTRDIQSGQDRDHPSTAAPAHSDHGEKISTIDKLFKSRHGYLIKDIGSDEEYEGALRHAKLVGVLPKEFTNKRSFFLSSMDGMDAYSKGQAQTSEATEWPVEPTLKLRGGFPSQDSQPSTSSPDDSSPGSTGNFKYEHRRSAYLTGSTNPAILDQRVPRANASAQSSEGLVRAMEGIARLAHPLDWSKSLDTHADDPSANAGTNPTSGYSDCDSDFQQAPASSPSGQKSNERLSATEADDMLAVGAVPADCGHRTTIDVESILGLHNGTSLARNLRYVPYVPPRLPSDPRFAYQGPRLARATRPSLLPPPVLKATPAPKAAGNANAGAEEYRLPTPTYHPRPNSPEASPTPATDRKKKTKTGTPKGSPAVAQVQGAAVSPRGRIAGLEEGRHVVDRKGWLEEVNRVLRRAAKKVDREERYE